jgi:hypothetical protein
MFIAQLQILLHVPVSQTNIGICEQGTLIWLWAPWSCCRRTCRNIASAGPEKEPTGEGVPNQGGFRLFHIQIGGLCVNIRMVIINHYLNQGLCVNNRVPIINRDPNQGAFCNFSGAGRMAPGEVARPPGNLLQPRG